MVERAVNIRLSVKDADRAVAELKKLGINGAKSIDRITKATKPASRGLRAINEASKAGQTAAQGFALRLGPVGGALSALGPAGLAAAAGIGAVTIGFSKLLSSAREAVDFADNIAKSADSIGLATDAFQEYSFAAGLASVSQQKFESGVKAFTKQLGELRATGKGTLAEFLKPFNSELLASLQASRSTEEGLEIILRAIAELDDRAAAAALSAAAFGRSAGIAFTNLAAGAEDARRQARELGIVLDEDLLRSAEETANQLEAMQRVIDANLTQALLTLSPILVDIASGFASVARFVGDTVEGFKDIEDQATGALERRLASLKELQADLQDDFLANALRSIGVPAGSAVDEKIAEVEAILEARRLSREEAEAERAALAAAGAAQLQKQRAAEDAAKAAEKAAAAAERQAKADQAVIDSLKTQATEAGRLVDAKTAEARILAERQNFIDAADRRLSAAATGDQRKEVERLAGALFDERQALKDKAAAEREATRAATEALNATVETTEVQRELETTTAGLASTGTQFFSALVTGTNNWTEALGQAEQALLRIGDAFAARQLEALLNAAFGLAGLGGGGLEAQAAADVANPAFAEIFDAGGSAGGAAPRRAVDPRVFAGAPRLQRGSLPGLAPNEVAAILHRGEIVLNPEQSAAARGRGGDGPARRFNIGEVNLVMAGGEGGFAGGATPDQFANAFLDRLDQMERERR
jgi:hypothetical protein